MRALITGVGGFCGAHLVSRLRYEDNTMIAGLDRMPEPPPHVSLDRYFEADITEANGLSFALRAFRPDFVFHLAGLSGNSVSATCIYEVNVTGTVRLLDAVRCHAPDCNVLLVGSAAEYGPVDADALPAKEEMPCHPVGPYAISKYAATLIGLDYARRLGLKVVVVRPSNIVGPGVPTSLVVGALIARAKEALASSHPVVKVGDSDSERDFIAVSDAVDAYVRLAQAGFRGEIFNICFGRAYSIRRIAEILLSNASRPITLQLDPDLVPPSPIRCFYGSYEKAAEAIGFRPSASLEKMLKAAWVSEMGVSLACASRCS